MELTGNEINMSFERVFCARHGEPFMAQWPKGFPIAMVKLFQLITAIEDFWNQKVEGESDKAYVERVLDVQPACCRVTDEEMLKLYYDSRIGKRKKCKNCGNKATGTEYQLSFGMETRTHSHICFNCVIYWMKDQDAS